MRSTTLSGTSELQMQEATHEAISPKATKTSPQATQT